MLPRHMRTTKKALAASFVMTFAAGCDSKGSAPPAAPTVDVGTGAAAPAAASAGATATGTAAATGTATAPATATATAGGAATGSSAKTLPPAPSTGHVARQSDGTCMWFADVVCPRGPTGRPIACNPPRPHEVECPPDAGKSP
jgi:hypothetical protein